MVEPERVVLAESSLNPPSPPRPLESPVPDSETTNQSDLIASPTTVPLGCNKNDPLAGAMVHSECTGLR
jgi:hypothetical protein